MAKQIVIMFPDEFEGTENFTIEFIDAHEEVYNVEEAETLTDALEIIAKENDEYIEDETQKDGIDWNLADDFERFVENTFNKGNDDPV